jgi:hypothetical protein
MKIVVIVELVDKKTELTKLMIHRLDSSGRRGDACVKDYGRERRGVLYDEATSHNDLLDVFRMDPSFRKNAMQWVSKDIR